MSTLAPEKSVASVSLLDAERDPEGFSDELGSSFERYGFAIVADHGIPADLIQRAEEKAAKEAEEAAAGQARLEEEARLREEEIQREEEELEALVRKSTFRFGILARSDKNRLEELQAHV